ncbi:MAG: aryl-sulfate sulfotransferase, partial [Acidobacteriaceae bacterium]
VWNEFDHLDVNRYPTSFPDWTHTNDVLYSKDDGNLLVSMRHQSWVVKVDYNNGAGAGDILWRLGYQGDFQLVGGTDPTDWFYGQHEPSFTTPNTTGIFGLTLMDNGDFRIFPAGVTCGTGSAPPCLYSTIPVLQINETAKTATIETHQILPTNLYNFFGGNSEQLANGNLEYDLCGLPGAPNSQIFETPNQSTPQTVWNMKVTGNYFYRGYRLPSLYPGVQW